MEDTETRISITAIMELWSAWEKGIMPLPGGWLDQPISDIVKINAIDLVINTYRYKTSKDADWSKFSKEQRELIRWLDE